MEQLLRQQQNEITEYHIYTRLADMVPEPENQQLLREIAAQELEHYHFWEKVSGRQLAPRQSTVRKYVWLARLFGLAFALRHLEKNEAEASAFYDQVAADYPEALRLKAEEEEHEQKLIGLLEDKRLSYAGAIVLGLNDALVEFTGTLAGLTFAFNNSLIVATTGLVMGVAAALSMAASGYLASREDDQEDVNPITSAIYTGVAYIGTVFFLVLPYFLFANAKLALAVMLVVTVLIIAAYTYYISVAKA
ncbi:MAG: rubrerythrin family protein, partial [Bacteroidetes bacterium]